MAGDGDEETEYQSDPEEVKMSLKMRRREASDDEEAENGGRDVEDGLDEKSDRSEVDSDGESDGQGGAAVYDYEELEGDEEEGEYSGEEEVEAVVNEEYGGNDGEVFGGGRGESEGLEAAGRHEEVDVGESTEEQKKENEPFLVPTAGAFYMHDDRFRDSAGGRDRHMFGGRKLWESRDDRKWGHDKFEEMSTREGQYDERRKAPRGHPRGRGRGRGADRGFVRGSRPRSYTENHSKNFAPKSVRGRGPRRYQALSKGKNDTPLSHGKQMQRPFNKASYASSGRVKTSAPHAGSDSIPSKGVASNLNYASPPFYPSGASSEENVLTSERGDQSGNSNRNIHPPVQQSNSSSRGKCVVDTTGMEKLYIVDPALVRPTSNAHLPSASLSSNAPRSREQRHGISFPGFNSFQAHTKKASSACQTHHAKRVSGHGQTSLPMSTQQFRQQTSSASQGFSAPQSGLSVVSFDSEDADPPSESSKLKGALAGKGKGTAQKSRACTSRYGDPQITSSSGPVGVSHSDQKFPASTAFLPVMQFGGQHPGGIGVPAVGMAFPGYVQSQHGVGNSEMTWLPVLTGTGPLGGGSYYPPYITVDGSYSAPTAGQPPALAAPSKDGNANKPDKEWNSPQTSDRISDEYGQRQNKPRRYSEMNFGQ